MTRMVSLLRGVNVVGRNKVPMERLRLLYEKLSLKCPVTFIQSGNVVFETDSLDEPALAERLEAAIEGEFGFRPSVILRSADEMRQVIAQNPFAGRTDIAPDKLLVFFLKSDPGEEARLSVRSIPVAPEELIIHGREMYVYYTGGQGRSKLPIGKIERAHRVPATARNWNSVFKLMAMLEKREFGRSA